MLTAKAFRRGVHGGDRAREAGSHAPIAAHNTGAASGVWTKTADESLAGRACFAQPTLNRKSDSRTDVTTHWVSALWRFK